MNYNINRSRKGDIGLQCLAINELEQIAVDNGKVKGLQEIICISLCQYLSSYSDFHLVIDAGEEEKIEMMLEYLLHVGYLPCIERSSMTIDIE